MDEGRSTMKHKGVVTILTLLIAVLVLFSTGMGLFYNSPEDKVGRDEKVYVQSIYGEKVQLEGKGLYRHDSVSGAAQEKGQDTVSLVVAVPILLLALTMFRKGKLKGQLLLAGMYGYFLYTYASMSFLTMYNQLFLVYVALFSMSLFGFVMILMGIDRGKLSRSTKPKMPRRLLGGTLLFVAVMLSMMWLGRIVPSLTAGGAPVGLEHATTLVIQVLDLGIVVPACVLIGILVLKRDPFGTMLASVFIIKAAMLITAIEAMIFMMARSGVPINPVEVVVFGIFGALAYLCLVQLLRNIEG